MKKKAENKSGEFDFSEKAKKRVQELREQRNSLQKKFNHLIMDKRSITLPE